MSHEYKIVQGKLWCTSPNSIEIITIPPYKPENFVNIYKYCPNCGEMLNWKITLLEERKSWDEKYTFRTWSVTA